MSSNELLYKGDREFKDPVALFSKYNVSDKDLVRYKKMIENGQVNEAEDEFVTKYMIPASERYSNEIIQYLQIAQTGEMDRKYMNAMIASISLLALTLFPLLKRNFRRYTRESYAPLIFDKYGITSEVVKRAILDNTLQQFATLTDGAMTQTQANVLYQIRKMQQEMIIFNQQISKDVFITDTIDNEIALFKKNLMKTMPDYYKGMEEGNILKDRLGRSIKLDNYADMATRNTILNVDRMSVETISKINQDRVVEYYKRDQRSVKNPRVICMNLLGQKVEGKSLLALDPTTAKVLGIMYIEDAKAQGAMQIYCRHGIKPVSNTFAKKLEKKYFSNSEE